MNTVLGKVLIVAGILIALSGVVIYFRDTIPFLRYLGKLPGDIVIKKENFSMYFPVATCIILSVVLSLIMFLINKLR